jgi:hypothetical protein
VVDLNVGSDKVLQLLLCLVVLKVLGPIAEAYGERGRRWVHRQVHPRKKQRNA